MLKFIIHIVFMSCMLTSLGVFLHLSAKSVNTTPVKKAICFIDNSTGFSCLKRGREFFWIGYWHSDWYVSDELKTTKGVSLFLLVHKEYKDE